jgi:hypothetical protein
LALSPFDLLVRCGGFGYVVRFSAYGACMTKLAAVIAIVAALLGGAVGFLAGHSSSGRAETVAAAGRVTTVHATADAPTRTVTHVVVHTHTVTTTAPAEAAAPTASADCNDLPASSSTNLTEIRESRCEVEKLNAENPSTADEREIETMISEERSIEASE